MNPDVFFILSMLIVGAVSYDNATIGDLPSEIVLDVLAILNKTTLTPINKKYLCYVTKSDIRLLLYTRNNRDAPIYLNISNPSEIDKTKAIKLLIHGWVSKASTFVPEMKDAYLDRYDCSVIILDWSKLSLQLYWVSVCHLPEIAILVANFLCLLDEKFNIPVNSIHLIGHSLGGQMSGFIGQSTLAKCFKQVGRITGLDPAGPYFQSNPIARRLDKSDAAFVDVIHTNAGVLGYWGDCGTVDFYVNCGTIQLNCPNFSFNWKDIFSLPISIVICHHMRSIDYMTESILHSNRFEANQCRTCPIPCLNSLLFSSSITTTAMGEACSKSATGGYVLLNFDIGILCCMAYVPVRFDGIGDMETGSGFMSSLPVPGLPKL